jgi:cytochrome c556
MKDLGASFKIVRDQLKQSSPDMAAIKLASENIRKSAEAMSTWFPTGSGTESGVKTGAKPEIWNDAATFDSKRSNFYEAARRFKKITESGDIAAISTDVRPLSTTCKGCHDLFFNDEH